MNLKIVKEDYLVSLVQQGRRPKLHVKVTIKIKNNDQMYADVPELVLVVGLQSGNIILLIF